MKLKKWSVVSENSFYLAPELKSYRLRGNVYGHPRFNDGESVTTSDIVGITDKGIYKEVITESGSVYELHKEDVDPECEKQFPGYYDRLELTIVD